MSGPRNALAQWGSSALRPVELPTGTRALVKLPNVQALIAAQSFPQDLRKLAAQFVRAGINVAELDDAELGRMVAFTYELVGRSLKYLAPRDSEAWDAFVESGNDPIAEGWQPVTLTGADVAEMDIDQDDLDALANIAMRRTTTLDVTFTSRMARGVISEQERKLGLARDVAGGGGESLDQLAGFRHEPGGSERGTDRGEVRAAAVGADAGRGSRRGSGARRSGRA